MPQRVLPWDAPDAFPASPASGGYGFGTSERLEECEPEELVERCVRGEKMTIAWTPELSRLRPLSEIPLLAEALQTRRIFEAERETRRAWSMMALGLAGLALRSRPSYLALLVIGVLHLWDAQREKRAVEEPAEPATAAVDHGARFEAWIALTETSWTGVLMVALCLLVALFQVAVTAMEGSQVAFARAAFVKAAVWQGSTGDLSRDRCSTRARCTGGSQRGRETDPGSGTSRRGPAGLEGQRTPGQPHLR